MLSQFVQLSQTPSESLARAVEPAPGEPASASLPDAAAPWTWTATEAARTEAVLLPFLIHLAAARDDIESLKYCLNPVDSEDASGALKLGMIPGGVVNCLEVGSGKAPLHVAALNGNTRSVELLLRAGALVHLRDMLGHTALYLMCCPFQLHLLISLLTHLSSQAARQKHEDVVDLLVQAGATLGGSDIHFVNSFTENIGEGSNHDPLVLRIWIKAGWKPAK